MRETKKKCQKRNYTSYRYNKIGCLKILRGHQEINLGVVNYYLHLAMRKDSCRSKGQLEKKSNEQTAHKSVH